MEEECLRHYVTGLHVEEAEVDTLPRYWEEALCWGVMPFPGCQGAVLKAEVVLGARRPGGGHYWTGCWTAKSQAESPHNMPRLCSALFRQDYRILPCAAISECPQPSLGIRLTIPSRFI